MKTKTSVKSGGLNLNRNQTLKVRTGVKSGGLKSNRNQTCR
jgi:hypothetical protein